MVTDMTVVSLVSEKYGHNGHTLNHIIPVSRHFGLRTLRTQNISKLSDWCRSVWRVWHQCRSVLETLLHWYQTVSTSSKHFLLQ